MDEIPISTPDDESRKPADADWLVPGTPAEPRGPTASPVDPGEGYSVEGLGDDPVTEEAVPQVSAAPPPPSKPAVEPKRTPERQARVKEVATVDEVWSRWAEWGPNLLLLGGVGLAILFILYLAFAAGFYGLMFFVFVAGGAALVILSYPIAITLERPVRMTPEQAVRDYYSALSHRFPHFRRMWLLLSSAGRTSGRFRSYEAFKAYWNERINEWNGERKIPLSPLRFTVDDFESAKSGGQTAIEATYAVKVSRRDGEVPAPIALFRIEASLTRGPDRMWYLDSGTLPDGD